MAKMDHMLGKVPLPLMGMARQNFPRPKVENLEKDVSKGLEHIFRDTSIPSGAPVAITAGSRGIENILSILRTVVAWVRRAGGEPFILGAMGSHGGGTAQGKLQVLSHLGITDESVGAPVVSSVESTLVGTTQEGHQVYWDSRARKAWGVLLVNRIKAHTDISGPCESGLSKMAVVGLGNLQGAASCHSVGFEAMGRAMLSFREVVFDVCPVLGGLGIVENAYEETALVRGLRKEEIALEEPKLLGQAKELMGKILVSPVEVLLVDRMGKDISGAGMDPNVIGRLWNGLPKRGSSFKAEYIGALALSEGSGGNGSGMTMAESVSRELYQALDLEATYANGLTAGVTEKIPMVLENHSRVLQAGLFLTSPSARVVRIRDTSSLEYLMFSTSLRDDLDSLEGVDVLEEPREIKVDREGNFLPWYP